MKTEASEGNRKKAKDNKGTRRKTKENARKTKETGGKRNPKSDLSPGGGRGRETGGRDLLSQLLELDKRKSRE